MRKELATLTVAALTLTACGSATKQTNAAEATDSVATTAWDKSYGGADKSYDTELLKMREEIAPRFQTLEFNDAETGKTMTYNLFVPKDYDKSQSYPLVLFMADGSTTGRGALAPLMQGYGGIIWATDESQAEHPAFVLVPSFVGPENVVNDQWETSYEVNMVLRLLDKITAEYSVDKSRLYTTGQSMGGMMSFYFNATNPDLFAASLFVGSQWDINVLSPLAKATFFYVVSAGDKKASGGMKELGELFDKEKVDYGTTQFSARLSDEEKDSLVEKLISEGHKRNFVKFDAGTVIPEGTSNPSGEHMYSFDYAYKLKSVRNWLMSQKK